MAQPTTMELGKHLHDWAYGEMNFQPQGRGPTEQDFIDSCRGPVNDIWKFLIANVKSSHRERKAGGKLRQEKARLLSEISHLKKDNGALEQEYSQLQGELLDTERAVQKKKDESRNNHRKAMLLRKFSDKCSFESALHKEFSKRVSAKTDRIKVKSREKSSEVYYTKETVGGRKGSETEIETACCKSVRECCEVICEFLHEVLNGSLGGDTAVFNDRRNQLWSALEKVMSEFTVGQIVEALIVNTHESMRTVRDKVQNTDVQKDVQQLQFNYHFSGALDDVSSGHNVFGHLDRLLEECHAEHLQRVFETEKNENEVWRLDQQIERLTSELQKLLEQQYLGRPKELQLARRLVAAELQLARDRAVQQSYQDQMRALKQSIQESRKQAKDLLVTQQQIQDFKALAEKKQELIHVLVKQNTNLFSRLPTQRSEIVEYVGKNMPGYKEKIVSLIQRSEGAVQEEVEKFVSLSLPYLRHTWLDSSTKLPYLDTLIHQIDRGDNSKAGKTLLKTMPTLKFPLYKAPELLLSRCLEVKVELDDAECLHHYHTDLGQRLAVGRKDDKGSAAYIRELCQRVKVHDQQQTEKVLLRLTSKMDTAKATFNDFLKLDGTIEDWWEQPAQYTIPWVKFKNMNIQQWVNQVNVDSAKARQEKLNLQESFNLEDWGEN